MSRSFLVLHGRGTRCAHIRLHHGHWEPAFPVPRVLVRSQRRQRVRGSAGGVCREFTFTVFVPSLFLFQPRTPLKRNQIQNDHVKLSSSSAAVSEVSGGSPSLPARRLLLLALRRLRDAPGDHQCEARCPVAHRHSENQEAAVRISPAMTATSDHANPPTPPANNWTPPTLSPHHHLISASHGNQ